MWSRTTSKHRTKVAPKVCTTLNTSMTLWVLCSRFDHLHKWFIFISQCVSVNWHRRPTGRSQVLQRLSRAFRLKHSPVLCWQKCCETSTCQRLHSDIQRGRAGTWEKPAVHSSIPHTFTLQPALFILSLFFMEIYWHTYLELRFLPCNICTIISVVNMLDVYSLVIKVAKGCESDGRKNPKTIIKKKQNILGNINALPPVYHSTFTPAAVLQ